MKKKKDMKKENKLGLIVLICSIFVCLVAVSYAIWTKTFFGQKENSIDTATLILTLDESESNSISLINAVPVSDQKGLTYDPYDFKVRNSGTIPVRYRVMIVNDTALYKANHATDKMLDWSNIKYSFSKNSEAATKGLLSDTSGVLKDQFDNVIEPGQTDTYSLKLWIKSEATNEIMNQQFHGTIKVEAVQSDQTLD